MTDVAAAYGMAGWPFWAVIGALFVIVLTRSHLIYWLGRGAFSGASALAGQIARGHDPRLADPQDPGSDGTPGTGSDGATGSRSGSGSDETLGTAEPHPAGARASATAAGARPGARPGAAPGGRLHRLLTSSTAQRGLRLVHRWGPAAVTLAYLTVGLQTAVFAGAGLLRMPYLRFTIASVPGSIAWAFVWGTVGLGALWAAVALATRSPWALAGVLVAVLALIGWLVARRRARRTGGPEGTAGGTAVEQRAAADQPAAR